MKTGDVGQARDTIYATKMGAAASSLHRVALCGGNVYGAVRNYCQVYSTERDE